MEWPGVTFGLLSWNRFRYLRATLESAFECIDYPNMEWIVSDNESIEPGLSEYLKQHTKIDRLISKTQTHAAAMNELVDVAQGKYIIIWPEDIQFVVKGDWLKDAIEVMEANPDIGSVALDALRKCTLDSYFTPALRTRLTWARRDLRCFHTLRRPKRLLSSRNEVLFTLGGAFPGVCGSGIPTLTRTEIWKEMGGWRTRSDGKSSLIDSSLGAEDNMVETFYRSGKPYQMALLGKPVAADIITDATGCKAKVRGGFRYGDYMPPVADPYYYRIRPLSDYEQVDTSRPLNFFDITEPLGFDIPRDANGDRLKSSLNTSIVFDIAANRAVDYPLRMKMR